MCPGRGTCIFREQRAMLPGLGPLRCHPIATDVSCSCQGFGGNWSFLFRAHSQGLPFPPQQRWVFWGLPTGCTAVGWTSALLGGSAAESCPGGGGDGEDLFQPDLGQCSAQGRLWTPSLFWSDPLLHPQCLFTPWKYQLRFCLGKKHAVRDEINISNYLITKD